MINKRVILPLVLSLLAASPLFAITRSWTGAVSANWSDPANWSPSGTPAPADALVFPAQAANRAMTNDLPTGTTIGGMSVFDLYVLGGNPLTLTGDLSVNETYGFGLTLNSDVKLGGPVNVSVSSYVRFTGDLNVNGQTLTFIGPAFIHGTLSGTGLITGSGLQIAGGGSFGGTIQGLRTFSGSLPNATVTASSLDAVGIMGDLTTDGFLDVDGGLTNVLNTESLLLKGSLGIDLYAPASDQLKVDGTVTLQGPLTVRIQGPTPTPGQSYMIVDNAGTDPVNGTFAGLPEGAIFTVDGRSFQISYAGGDGNDVVLTVVVPNKEWTGAVSGFWSDGGNWSPQGTPSPGQVLVFPRNTMNRAMTNDLPAGMNVGAMTFFDDYILSGNPLTLTGDLSAEGSFGQGLTVNLNARLGGPVHFSPEYYSYVRFTGDLDINGQTLTLAGGTTYIHGTLSGTGTIVGDSAPSRAGLLKIAAGGSFSGSIGTALRSFSGSLPNATVTASTLDAVGTMGDVTVDALTIAGTSTGVLHTKSVLLRNLGIDLYPPGSDQLKANGTVTLEGTLNVRAQGELVVAGQSYMIIDNDGTDPVNGTFAGLPEGATIIVAGYSFQISYAGGDGNDVVLTASLSNKVWTGAVSAAWSDGRNWSPQGTPSTGQILVFPYGVPNRAMTNDLPAGTSVGAMRFFDSYIVGGNALTLTDDLGVGGPTSPYGVPSGVTLTLNTRLGGPVQIFQLDGTQSAYARFTGDLNVNGQTLTVVSGSTYIHGSLSGTGLIADAGTFGGSLEIAGGGSFSGSIRKGLTFSGSLPGAAVTTWKADAVGTVGDLTILPNAPFSSNGSGSLFIANSSAGVLHTKSVRLAGTLFVDLKPAGSSDRLQANGTVTLEGSLHVQVWTTPAPGQSFVIIDNDGTDAVNGTFDQLPEGAMVTQSLFPLQISYSGGDGNDVVLRVVQATATALTQDANESVFGQPVALTAVVTSVAGPPTGTVFFTANGISIGTAPLVNGVATIAPTTLKIGTNNIVAAFHGTGIFADTTSNFVSHVVVRGRTAVTVASDRQNAPYGATIRFTATVSPVAPAAGSPAGNVNFLADGIAIGTGQLAAGTATLETSALHAGFSSITATYAGDVNFEGNTSPAVQQNVGKVQTEVDARPRIGFVGEPPLITVFVNAIPSSALVPTGVVSVSEGSSILGTQALSGNAVNISLNPLGVGDHTLVVNYGGDSNFEPSSEIIVQTVEAPRLSVDGVHVLEGNRGITNVSLVISLSAPVAQPVQVSFSTVAGSAASGEDYESMSGVVEFAPGETTRAIEIHIIGDTFPEPDETFSVLLTNPVNATIDTSSAIIVVVNDDQVPPRRRPSTH